jgi:hypothetical protein
MRRSWDRKLPEALCLMTIPAPREPGGYGVPRPLWDSPHGRRHCCSSTRGTPMPPRPGVSGWPALRARSVPLCAPIGLCEPQGG